MEKVTQQPTEDVGGESTDPDGSAEATVLLAVPSTDKVDAVARTEMFDPPVVEVDEQITGYEGTEALESLHLELEPVDDVPKVVTSGVPSVELDPTLATQIAAVDVEKAPAAKVQKQNLPSDFHTSFPTDTSTPRTKPSVAIVGLLAIGVILVTAAIYIALAT